MEPTLETNIPNPSHSRADKDAKQESIFVKDGVESHTHQTNHQKHSKNVCNESSSKHRRRNYNGCGSETTQTLHFENVPNAHSTNGSTHTQKKKKINADSKNICPTKENNI